MDRQFTPAAGMVGFIAAHRRLTQLPHEPSMTALGHDGSHFSYCSTAFVTTFLAPLLQTRLPDLATAPAVAQATIGSLFIPQALEPRRMVATLAALPRRDVAVAAK